VTTQLDAAVLARLRAVAIAVAMQTGPGLDEAIALAEQLTASGLGGPATLDVASLPRGSVRSDAEPVVRAMLTEFGMEVPPAEDEEGRYRLLLWTFGHADLPYEIFEGPFYARLTAWDMQDELDRKLIRLLDERDQLSRPSEREAIEGQMRAAVRAAISAA
jgi:hypothetical protein